MTIATWTGEVLVNGTPLGKRGTLIATPAAEGTWVNAGDHIAYGSAKAETDGSGVIQGGLDVEDVDGLLYTLTWEPHDNSGDHVLGSFDLSGGGDIAALVPTVPVAVDESLTDSVLDLIADLGSFTTANDAVVAPLFNSGTATRTAADKAYQRGISVKAHPYNATGNGTTDDSAAIRSAIAAATSAGTSTYFPEGNYLVSEEGTTQGCLNLPSGARLTGPGKINRDPAARAGVRPIQIDGKSDVRIDGLTVDMNGAGGVGAHCIQTKDSTHIYISKVKCLTGGRGGISIMGASTHYRITECEIYSPIFNGITFYGSAAGGYPLAADDIAIDKCHIEAGVQPIDSEPIDGYASNVRITNSYLATTDNYAVAMTGTVAAHNRKWLVEGNEIIGAIAAYNNDDSKIVNNQIDASGATSRNAIHGFFGSRNLLIDGNTIIAATDKVGIYPAYSGTDWPASWIVTDNDIWVSGSAAYGIRFGSGDSITISENRIHGANSLTGILVIANTRDILSALVTDNHVDGFVTGISSQVASAFVIKKLTVGGNQVDNTQGTPTATTGLLLSGTAAQFQQTTMYGNLVAPIYTTDYNLGSVLLREGSAAPATWSGNGSPESVVTAKVGAMYKRRDGSTGTSLYVKETGTGTTGWVAYSAGGGGGTSTQTTARLTADTTPVNNSTTAVNVTDLALAVAANSKYRLTAFIVYSASVAADVGVSWSVPTAAALTWTSNAAPVTASTAVNTIQRSLIATAGVGQLGAIGVGTKLSAMPTGTLTTGANVGTLQFKFAQVTADATDAVIYADSWITLEKVS